MQVQTVLRMHDLSDGFAVLGFSSTPRVVPSISGNTTQLRSNDGAAYFELASGHVANIVAPGGINITGPVFMNGKRVDETHAHVGVRAGPDTSGAVA